MSVKRVLLADAVIGKITQGTIFSGAKSTLYPNKEVMGIVITPRCDIAQQKVDVYYYLPVVSFEDWKHIELPALYLSKLVAEHDGKLRKELIANGISDSIVNRFSIQTIKEIIKDKQVSNKNLNSLIKQSEDIESYRNGAMTISQLIKKYEGPKKTILKEIVMNKNLNYYLIETAEDRLYIIRMRELNRIQSSLFNQLRNGIDYQLTNGELLENDICQFNEYILMPLYEVKSPFIEHIMYHFLQSFNRIGIEDMSETTQKKVFNVTI